ncbi:MAG: isoaspartyl peptidase/L-asparaginase, partial [Saprospiraceae bacterium]|nr:isoaspartyl peptidase/L-asparaginase [Saprospiraceae bacterium]
MTKILLFIGSLLLLVQCTNMSSQEQSSESKSAAYAIVIHGGAGTITRDNMTDEKEQAYTNALNAALDEGIQILAQGGEAKDAVIAAIKLMEDSPLFNAGKGSVFTHDGENEMDASIMDGATLNAGAIGGVKTIKNPITAAEAVMSKSDHVMMVGSGAEAFAISQGLDTIDPSYFKTERRWNSLQRILEKEKSMGAHISALADSKYGTVGAVALDKNGNIVAGTSTGGMTNKKFNRIGDSPIIGAGTYANNKTCGVSCTGHGEYFIRYAVAYDVSA